MSNKTGVPAALPHANSQERVLLNSGPSSRGWHRLEKFLQCNQAYQFEYGGKGLGGPKPGLIPPEEKSEVLINGSLIHLGIAHHYARLRQRQNNLDEDVYYEPEVAMAMEAKVQGGTYKECVSDCIDTVLAYIDYWKHRDNIRVLYVEDVFTIHYNVKGPPILRRMWNEEKNQYELVEETTIPMTARVDLGWEENGKIYLVDTKTAGRFTKAQPKFYAISGQLINYRWIGFATFGNKDFGGVILNRVQHPKPDFDRQPLSPAPSRFSKFPQIIEDAERSIARLELEDREMGQWPAATNELTCETRYGPCKFWDLCSWGSNTVSTKKEFVP